uniref:Uncharacterized protein n=1 Tax=Podarcis muralis TaxID=64176 RepID=A0A670I0V2_PODMU
SEFGYSLCDEATCSICLDYFKDPVMIPECGHNFCRSCLIQSWGESEAEAFCPHCRETVQERRLIPNWPLQNVVDIAKKLSLQEGKEEGGKEKVCEKHQEPLKLFCKEDGAPICLVCDRSKEHVCHETIPLKEASKEYKVGNYSGFWVFWILLGSFSVTLRLQGMEGLQFYELNSKKNLECSRAFYVIKS